MKRYNQTIFVKTFMSMPHDSFIESRSLLRELRDIALLTFLGFAMTVAGLTCQNCAFGSSMFWKMTSFSSVMWIVLWKGNDYLTNFISTQISWLHFPVKRFVVGLVGTFAFTLTAIQLLTVSFNALFQINLSLNVFISVVITLIISLFLHGRGFLLNWRQTAIDAERLQRENIASRYETLKNQVNPHFLFNSFNALSNLVHDDPDKAVAFIKQLSEVYRYVLDTREKEIVPIEEELKFLSSYIFLQQIRFGAKLNIQIAPFENDFSIAPLALQMLFENAIKHNVVSEEDPLTISITREGNDLVVTNNLQKKSTLGEPSAGLGLDNITRRYEFLSSQKVVVEQSATHFIVKLPVIPL